MLCQQQSETVFRVRNTISLLRVKKSHTLYSSGCRNTWAICLFLASVLHTQSSQEIRQTLLDITVFMCIGFFWGAATINISTWKKVKDISASWFFLHVFLQFSADYPLSPVGLVLLNILLGTGHREPDGLLVKLNLYWQDSFVYF